MPKYIGFKDKGLFNPNTLKCYFSNNSPSISNDRGTEGQEAIKGWEIVRDAIEKAGIVEEIKNSPLYVSEKS